MNELLLISATLMSGMLANSERDCASVDYPTVRRRAIEQAALLIQETLRAQGKVAGN